MRVEVDLAHRDADVAAGGRGDMDLAAAADGAGGDADPVGGFNAGIDVGHVSRSKGSGARTGFSDVDHRPSLRRYYPDQRSEEHTSELQSLMRISYAVFCLNKKHILVNTFTEHNTPRQTSTTHTTNVILI